MNHYRTYRTIATIILETVEAFGENIHKQCLRTIVLTGEMFQHAYQLQRATNKKKHTQKAPDTLYQITLLRSCLKIRIQATIGVRYILVSIHAYTHIYEFAC